MIVLTGGKVYGILNTTAATTEHVSKPQEMDVIISAGRILALMEPSKTASFVNYMKTQNLQILPISVQDQLVIPGLIDPHVHAIGGGGEQGMFGIQMGGGGLSGKCDFANHSQSFCFFCHLGKICVGTFIHPKFESYFMREGNGKICTILFLLCGSRLRSTFEHLV